MYGHPAIVVAMNESLSPELATLCIELNAHQGGLPDVVELIPAGQHVIGRDGRAWLNDQPQAILDAFAADGKDLPVDWNHATELKARHGEPSPAAGWINKLEVRDGGSIWGHVTWTDAGRNSLQAREYRYLSPTFLFERETGRITRMGSVGLVNKPNLPLPALNQESLSMQASDLGRLLTRLMKEKNITTAQLAKAGGISESTMGEILRGEIARPPENRLAGFARVLGVSVDTIKKTLPANNGEDSMNLSKAICAALGLADNATEAQAISAINQLRADIDTARNAQQTPSLDLYVPRADYDAQVQRATNAEQQLESIKTEAQEAEIKTEIEAALNAGKITPASVEFYTASCAQEGGLERFRKFCESAPQIVPDTELDNKKPEGDGTALNAEAQAVADQFCNSVEDIKKYGQA